MDSSSMRVIINWIAVGDMEQSSRATIFPSAKFRTSVPNQAKGGKREGWISWREEAI